MKHCIRNRFRIEPPASLVLLGLVTSFCVLACGGKETPSGPSGEPTATNGGAEAGTATATSGASPGGATNVSGGSANQSGTSGSGGSSAHAGTSSAAGATDSGGAPATGGGGNMGVAGPLLVDPRDNTSYPTVVINGHTWMAENLRFATATGSWCQDADPECTEAGRYYAWSVALGLPAECDAKQCVEQLQPQQQGVCPAGWHVTNGAEWESLFVSESDCLKAKATSNWPSGAGNNGYGLSVEPTGYRAPLSGFMLVNPEAQYWTTEERDAYFASGFGVGSTGCAFDRFAKDHALSVRCIQNQ